MLVMSKGCTLMQSCATSDVWQGTALQQARATELLHFIICVLDQADTLTGLLPRTQSEVPFVATCGLYEISTEAHSTPRLLSS